MAELRVSSAKQGQKMIQKIGGFKNKYKLTESSNTRDIIDLCASYENESMARRTEWLQHGCNAFDQKRPMSNPMAFWTEQDVLHYIYDNQITISSVYGDVVKDENGVFHTTGCDRTGCIFCGFGCHLDKSEKSKFQRLKETHPKIYDYIMRPTEKGGLNYKEIINWLNEHGNLNIRY